MPVTTDPRAIGRDLEAAVSKLTRDIAIESVAELFASTPVDTGHARSNWVPVVSKQEPIVAEFGSRQAVNRTAQIIGTAALASYRIKDGPIWIKNGAPYIWALDAGHSKQAPAGFIRAALARAARRVRRRIKQ